MTTTAETIDEAAPVEARPVSSTWRRRLVVVATVGLLLVVAYLGASLVAPQTVPRPIVLPRPASSVTYDDCNGRTGTRTTEQWERTGPFWTAVRFRVGGLCIDQPPG